MKSFSATLEMGNARLGWVIARVPFSVPEEWQRTGNVRVKGDINGFGFRGCLFPCGGGRHYLLVTRQMQAGGRVGLGVSARFRVEPDTEERPIEQPVELERILAGERALRRWHGELSPSMRRYIAGYVAGVKSPAARERRANEIAERLMATMEAERDLPPALRTAFARDARAREGWKSMSLAHRRQHLLAYFGYKSPEAQSRRLARTLEEARKRAGD